MPSFARPQLRKAVTTKRDPSGTDCVVTGASQRAVVAEFKFTPHIEARGEEAKAIKRRAGFRARRWVVERTHNLMNRFRCILIGREKGADTHVAIPHVALVLITWRAGGLLR